MGQICYVCHGNIGTFAIGKFSLKELQELGHITPTGMGSNDRICGKCFRADAGSIDDQETEREIIKEPSGQSSTSSPMGMSNNSPTINPTDSSSPSTIPKTTSMNLSECTTSIQLRQLIRTLHDQYKDQWDKNGVVQIKTESLAILQRMWGQQVQFIVACDQLSKEGYRLMAIDEGKEGSTGGFSGGVNAYFYFQKMDYVR